MLSLSLSDWCCFYLVLYYNTHTRLAVIRCAREMCKIVETSLVFVTNVHNQEISLRVVRVCGANSLSLAQCFVPLVKRVNVCVCAGLGSSHGCRDHVLKVSMERAKTLNVYTLQPHFDEEVQAEIALIDPK